MKKLVVFLCIGYLNFVQGATNPKRPKPTFNTHLIKYSKHEATVGRRIYAVWKELKQNKERTTQINLLKKELKKSKIFKDLTPIVNAHYRIIKVNTVAKFKSSCVNLEAFDTSTKFESEYLRKLKSYCSYKFLKVFSRKRIIKRNFNFVISYLNDFIVPLTSGKLRSPFSRFLKLATKNKLQKKRISKLFYEYYKSTNKSPLKRHISFLNIDENFNSLIQARKIHDPKSGKHYKRELRTQIRNIRSKIKKEINVKTLISNLLKFSKHNYQYIGKSYTRKKLLSLATSLIKVKYENDYMSILDLAKELSNEDQKDEVRFYVLLQSVISGDYEKSFSLIKKHGYSENFDKIDNSKLQYWIAKTYEQNGQIEKSIKMYESLIKKHPLSFYSIVSIKTLIKHNNKSKAESLLEKYKTNDIQFNFNPKTYQKNFLFNLKRLHVWLDLSLKDFISYEYDDLLNFEKKNIYKKRTLASSFDKSENEKHIFYLLLNSFHKKRQHLYSFKFIYKKLNNDSYDINSNLMDYLFPMAYWSNIKKRAKNIDPILVLSLIRQESAFNPSARSPVGARGLMQIMLPTARQYGRQITYKSLKRPNFNIKIGVKYLRRLIRKFDNNLIFTLAAYNAGETVVRRWRRTIKFSDDPIVAIEQIPYRETRNYVKLIYRNIFFYKFRNDSNRLKYSLDESFKISKI